MKKIIDLLKTFIFYLINFYRKIVFAFCCVFKINKDKVFVNCFDGKGVGDNPKYILDELFKLNDEIKVIWVYSKNCEYNQNIKYVRKFSIKAIYHQATSGVWISTVRNPYYSIKRKNQLYIQTWHGGMFFKKIEQDCEDKLSYRYIKTAKHDSKMIDYYISTSKGNTEYFLKYFWYTGGKILEIGNPRNDIWVKFKSEQILNIKEKFGVENKKILVYAPTFRRNCSLENYNLNFDLLLSELELKFKGEWVIFVRLHPRIAKKSKDFVKYNNKIIDASNIEDIQEILLITDFLITDYSSIVFDYILSDKAAIIYASDIEEYKRDRDFYISFEETPFEICTNNAELKHAINNFDYAKYLQSVKEFKLKFGYTNQGDASEKIALIIDNFNKTGVK